MAAKPTGKQTIASLLGVIAVAVLTYFLNGTDGGNAGNSPNTGAGTSTITSTSPANPPAPKTTAPKTTATKSTTTKTTTPKTTATRAAGDQFDPVSGLPMVSRAELPPEALDTLELIAAGGPYPFPRNDDQTYRNNNRVLPQHPGGYYREYTVITPGSDDRGARRIVSGDGGELYYTDDHYDSFRRIGQE